MSSASPQDMPLAGRVRVMQIIKFALIQGVVIFGGVAVFMAKKPPDDSGSFSSWILAGFGLAMIPVRFMVPPLMVQTGLRRLAAASETSAEQGQLTELYQTQMIVGSAILEGAAFTVLFNYLSTTHVVSLGIAALLLIGLAIDFPTVAKVEQWIAARQRQLAEERQLTRV